MMMHGIGEGVFRVLALLFVFQAASPLGFCHRPVEPAHNRLRMGMTRRTSSTFLGLSG